MSYVFGAGAFAVLALLTLLYWRARPQGSLLIVTSLVTAAWAGSLAYLSFLDAGVPFWAQFLEILSDACWLFLLSRTLHVSRQVGDGRKTLRGIVAGGLILSGVLAGYLIAYPVLYAMFGEAVQAPGAVTIGYVLLSIIGLMLVEQVYRNTAPEARWVNKFLCLGIGGLFAYDFFLYSDAVLFGALDENYWNARGAVLALVVPLIAVAAARGKPGATGLSLSRGLVFHTATLLGAGVYLLALATVGFYIRHYGGTWGGMMQAVFLFGAVLLLLVLLFSGKLRAALRVFISKHFFHYKYDYREEWLRFTQALTEAGDAVAPRERVIRAMAALVGSCGALLLTRDGSAGCLVTANWNLAVPLEGTGGCAPLLEFLQRRQWVIDLEEWRRGPDLYENLALPDWLADMPRTWLVVPLISHEQLLGFVVLAPGNVRMQINWEDRDLLKTAGRQAASYLALLDASEALADARQFEAFNRLSAFVVHDLKNMVAQLSLVVSNAARHKHNPAFMDDAIRTIDNTVERMNRLLAQLRKGKAASGANRAIDVKTVLQDVVERRASRAPAPTLQWDEEHITVLADPERFAAVLEHLVQNAQEATEVGGSVFLRLRSDGDVGVIEIADTGCGMDEQFIRERLFRPFDTTKGNAGMGIGVYESREFVRSLGGSLEVRSTPGKGTTFFIRVPRQTAAAAEQQLEVAS